MESESAQVLIRARGDLSIHEGDSMLQQVERRMLRCFALENHELTAMPFSKHFLDHPNDDACDTGALAANAMRKSPRRWPPLQLTITSSATWEMDGVRVGIVGLEKGKATDASRRWPPFGFWMKWSRLSLPSTASRAMVSTTSSP